MRGFSAATVRADAAREGNVLMSRELATALMMLAGTFYTLAAAIGIVRLPDLFTRMHASSKAGAVGAGLMLVAAALAGGEWPLDERPFQLRLNA